MWDLDTCQLAARLPCGRCMAEFDNDGGIVLACEAGIFHWARRGGDAASGKSSDHSEVSVVRFGPLRRINGPVDPTSLAGGRIGSVMAFYEPAGWTVLHRGTAQKKTTRLETKHDARRASASDDKRHVALANWEDGGASVFEASGGKRLVDLAVGKHVDLQFSPDNRWLATSSDGVRLWRVADWQLAHELHASGTFPNGLGIAFSPDSRVLAVGQPTGVLRLVDPESGTDWANLTHYDLACASRIAFSPDQMRLVTLQLEAELTGWVWNLAAMRPELAKRGLDWPADVLRCEASSPERRPLEVVIDDSGLIPVIDVLQRKGALRCHRAVQIPPLVGGMGQPGLMIVGISTIGKR